MAGCKVVKASMDQSVTNLLNCSTQYEEGAVKKVPKKKGCDLAKKQDSSLFLWYN